MQPNETQTDSLQSRISIRLLTLSSVVFFIALLIFGWSKKTEETHLKAISEPENALQAIVRALRVPLLGQKPLPIPYSTDSAGKPAVSWRASMVNDFESGIPIRFDPSTSLIDASNAELYAHRNFYFCAGHSKDSKRTSIFGVLNGSSVLEIGNEWLLRGDIPDSALVAVYVPSVLQEHWAAPGDICIDGHESEGCVIRGAEITVTREQMAICIFWNSESWEFTSKSGLQVALRFADLQYAETHELSLELGGIGRKVRNAATYFK